MTPAFKDPNQAPMLPFEKLHGLGNDFILIDLADFAACREGKPLLQNWNKYRASLARTLCDRNFGIGADGVIIGFSMTCLNAEALKGTEVHQFLSQYPDASGCDIGWIYINSDGSLSQMCGNGLRCMAVWARRKKLVANSRFVLSTAIGPVKLCINEDATITVNIGQPRLRPQDIPLSIRQTSTDTGSAGAATGSANSSGAPVVSHPIEVGSDKLKITCANVGNPHCVIFDDRFAPDIAASLESAHRAAPRASFFAPKLADLAQRLQALPLFSESANIEFARVRSPQEIDVIVWERGCGPTLACASGAAATLIAAVLEKRTERKCRINLPGGTVEVNWVAEDGSIEMTGPARFVFAGWFDLTAVTQMMEEPGLQSLSGGKGKIEVTCS